MLMDVLEVASLCLAHWQPYDTVRITNSLMTGADGLLTKQSLKYRYARAMGTLREEDPCMISTLRP